MEELRQHLISIGLSVSQAEKLSAIFKISIHLKKDELFHRANQTCNGLGFIVNGMCRYFYDTERAEITRWVALPNEFITSLGSFITQMPSKEYIQAIKPTALVVAHKKDWQSLYAEEEFVRQLWLKNIEANYVGMENRVFNLIAMTAEERYEWMLVHQPQFNEHVPDKYVASMLGIIPRHLSRIRARKK